VPARHEEPAVSSSLLRPFQPSRPRRAEASNEMTLRRNQSPPSCLVRPLFFSSPGVSTARSAPSSSSFLGLTAPPIQRFEFLTSFTSAPQLPLFPGRISPTFRTPLSPHQSPSSTPLSPPPPPHPPIITPKLSSQPSPTSHPLPHISSLSISRFPPHVVRPSGHSVRPAPAFPPLAALSPHIAVAKIDSSNFFLVFVFVPPRAHLSMRSIQFR